MSQQPKGDWDIGHGLRIPALKSSDDAEALHALLDPLPGMHAVHADTRRRRLRLEYDASQLVWPEIAQLLQAAGYPPANTFWGRARTAWFDYVDANTRRESKAPPPACCNRPPK